MNARKKNLTARPEDCAFSAENAALSPDSPLTPPVGKDPPAGMPSPSLSPSSPADAPPDLATLSPSSPTDAPPDFAAAMDYIRAVSWQGSRPGLSRVRALCHALGDPQNSLRFLHIAGTNGKGSVSAMLDSVLRAAGYTVGLYTSPYIYRFTERIRYNGIPISEEDFGRIIAKIRPLAAAMEDRPTEFELITAAAFVYYAEKRPDFVVLEVGLGGRLDATNIIETPILSLVTGISLDHTAVLGDTEEKIAAEKAGIFRAGVPVVCGAVSAPVAAVLSEKAKEVGAPLTFTDPSLLFVADVTRSGITFSYGEWRDLQIPFAALYQPANAAAVLTAVAGLRRAGLRLPEADVRRGLADVRWPGRFEFFSRDPDVIYDGSHNPEGIAATLATAERLYPGKKFVLLSGVMQDKNYQDMAKMLAPHVFRVFTVRPDNPRALDAGAYADAFFACGVPATACRTVDAGMTAARAAAEEEAAPLFILGSLYLYREAYDAFFAQKR